MTLSEQAVLTGVREFCNAHNISLEHVMAITVHINRTTSFASLIINWDKETILPNLPLELTNKYKEERVGNFLICYQSGMTLPDNYSSWDKSMAKLDLDQEGLPFCCNNLVGYKNKKLSMEGLFRDFFASRGNHRNVVYEVKKQVDNGPLLDTKYYQLLDDAVVEVQGTFHRKKHAFKNYKCTAHNRFYSIDLCDASSSTTTGYNYHHMRLHPFTKRSGDHEEVLEAFFKEVREGHN